MENCKVDHFWKTLEKMIECPVCDKRLTGPVYMCGIGHSICTTCTDGGTVCNVCQAPYTKIQNLLAENFLAKYDYVKIHLKDLIDSTTVNVNPMTVNVKEDVKYRCWITENCLFSATVADMVQHFRSDHMHHFDECASGLKLPYKKTWEMNYHIGKNFDRAIELGGLVFIVHISINGIGELGACVLMYTNRITSDKHMCQIEIECADENVCYKSAKVISAKSSERVVLGFRRSGLRVARNVKMYNALRQNQVFKCTVLIDRKEDMAVLEQNSTKQKIHKKLQRKQRAVNTVYDSKVIDDSGKFRRSNGALKAKCVKSRHGFKGETSECILS